MKINLAILFGGKSVEHEISIISALQAMRYLDRTKYDVYPIYISKANEMYYGKELEEIKEFSNLNGLLKKCSKVTFSTEKGKTYLVKTSKKLFEKKECSITIKQARRSRTISQTLFNQIDC